MKANEKQLHFGKHLNIAQACFGIKPDLEGTCKTFEKL